MRHKTLFVVFTIIIIKIIHWLLAHETIFRLSNNRKRYIKDIGLLHYTTLEAAEHIVSEQRLLGSLDYKSTFPSHRSDRVIWFLSQQKDPITTFCRWRVLRRHSPQKIGGQKKKIKYEVKLFVKGFSTEQIEKMKINIELGIGCYMDELCGVSVSYAPLSLMDRVLGVRNIDN